MRPADVIFDRFLRGGICVCRGETLGELSSGVGPDIKWYGRGPSIGIVVDTAADVRGNLEFNQIGRIGRMKSYRSARINFVDEQACELVFCS